MTSVVQVMGLAFPNRIGVAAGVDRDGGRLSALFAAGFGHVEVGTINATIGAAGDSALAPIIDNLLRHRTRSSIVHGMRDSLIGISIGSLRDALDARAIAEYTHVLRALAPLADYLVINLSRPGSVSREHRSKASALRTLLVAARAEVHAMCAAPARRVPMLVKVALAPGDPDALPTAVQLARELRYEGVLAAFERWPSEALVCARIAALRKRIGEMAIVAVGGVRKSATAKRYLDAGAALVQSYAAVMEAGTAVACTLLDDSSLCAS